MTTMTTPPTQPPAPLLCLDLDVPLVAILDLDVGDCPIQD
jgi:hypothetical protein